MREKEKNQTQKRVLPDDRSRVWLGRRYFGIPGLYTGMALGRLLGGVVGLVWFVRVIARTRTDGDKGSPIGPVHTDLRPPQSH